MTEFYAPHPRDSRFHLCSILIDTICDALEHVDESWFDNSNYGEIDDPRPNALFVHGYRIGGRLVWHARIDAARSGDRPFGDRGYHGVIVEVSDTIVRDLSLGLYEDRLYEWSVRLSDYDWPDLGAEAARHVAYDDPVPW